jgi:hypothetical protein
MGFRELFCLHNYNNTTREYAGETLSVYTPSYLNSVQMSVRSKRFRYHQTCTKCGKLRNFVLTDEEKKFII